MSSANLYRSAAGSVPTERTKIRGVVGDESLYTAFKSAVYKQKINMQHQQPPKEFVETNGVING